MVGPCIAMVIVWNDLARGCRIRGRAGRFQFLFQVFFSAYAYVSSGSAASGVVWRVDIEITVSACLEHADLPGDSVLCGMRPGSWVCGLRGVRGTSGDSCRRSARDFGRLLFTIVVMFSLQGSLVAPPLDGSHCRSFIIYFVAIFFVPFWMGRSSG